jgi:hypothetical protein
LILRFDYLRHRPSGSEHLKKARNRGEVRVMVRPAIDERAILYVRLAEIVVTGSTNALAE